MNKIDLMDKLAGMEQATLDDLRGAEKPEGGVRLPFGVVFAHVVNGDPKLKNQDDVQYFGGWAMDSDKVGEAIDAGDFDRYPRGWGPFEGISGTGTWNALGSRVSLVAPIAYRSSWLASDGMTRRPRYDRAGGFTRRHVQYLCQLSDGERWGPVVLSAKGYQTQYLLEALDMWRRAIAPLLKEINATQFPLSAFWVAIGTNGATPEYTNVGKSSTSRITPIRAALPEHMTAEQLDGRFVGPKTVQQNAELLHQAAEWLAAWREPTAASISGTSVAERA